MKSKPVFPKSAVVVKFTTKTGAKKFCKMIKSMLQHGDLPQSLETLLKKNHFENEILL